MTGKEEAVLEFIDFRRRVKETGIADHLSGTALTLLFISLGSAMWKQLESVSVNNGR